MQVCLLVWEFKAEFVTEFKLHMLNNRINDQKLFSDGLEKYYAIYACLKSRFNLNLIVKIKTNYI